jgi:NAD(P)-dependent dehydrogenase (short-subunit alcohol dehydrogenase family)
MSDGGTSAEPIGDSEASLSLDGARVVIAGGSSGIGLGVARAAHDRGAEVIILSRNPDRARIGDRARAIALDVTDAPAVAETFASLGSIDHLVCTAAGGFPPGLFSAPADDVRALMESKFWGQYQCARAAAPLLASHGSVTFTSGIRSRRPLRGSGAFTVVNMAVEGMTRALALELAPIRVNAVSPGSVETPVFQVLASDVRARRLEAAAAQTTVGRIGQPEEIAPVYLMCMTNAFLTGVVIDIDGGGILA